MLLRSFFTTALVAVLLAAMPAAAAEKKAATPEGGHAGPGNEVNAKVPQGYIQIPQMRLAVASDANRRYRMLEVEVWLSAATPEHIATLQSNKKKITAALKQDFLDYDWEAFSQPDTGIELAKSVVRLSVQRAVGVSPDEVIMRVLVLR